MNKYRVFGMTNDWGRPGCEGKYGGIGWYRIINPLEKLGADLEKGEFRIGTIDPVLKMKERGDIWVVKPMADVEAWTLIHAGKNFTGAKLVLDIDDDPFSVDKDHPQYAYHKGHEPISRMQIEMADHVIVSTEPLRQCLSQYNKNITVIENAIDPAIWKLRKPKKRTDGRIRLGWVGSGSHLADRSVIEEAIKEIMAKYPQVDFYHAGMCVVDGAENREFSFAGTKGYEEYPKFLNKIDLDIAIAPIKDTQFNRCKSNIKWLEHAMLKTPMVLSDVYPYQVSVTHGKDGFLAKSTKDWVKYLSILIENEEKRKEIGENAYKAVQKDWLIEKKLPKYIELFEKLMPKNITVYTSVTGGFDKLPVPKHTKTAEYVAFTDQKSNDWKVEYPYDKFRDDRRNSRIQKLMPHMYFDTEYSIYMDGNIELLVEPQVLIDEFLKDKDIAAFKHMGRNDIYEEAEAIAYYGKEKKDVLVEQIKSYSKQGVKANGGLCECGVLIRRHTPEVNQMNEKWWAEYCRYSCRDQMSFTKAFPIEKVYQIEPSVHSHPYFKFNSHENSHS
jgi:glycosyltransferase involved in cell wall biosynthesis